MKLTCSLAMLVTVLDCLKQLIHPVISAPWWFYLFVWAMWVWASIDFIFNHRVVKK